MEWSKFILLILIGVASSQIILECPRNWDQFGENCYRFEPYEKKVWQKAKESCQKIGATLLTVDSDEEHKFVENRLERYDFQNLMWYTSGTRNPQNNAVFVWSNDNREIRTFYWLDPNIPISKEKETDPYIVYKKDSTGAKYLWDLTVGTVERPYVCEVPLRLTTQLVVDDVRDFTFGQTDLTNIKRGPKFTREPDNVVHFPDSKVQLSLECLATSNPNPSYKWTRSISGTSDSKVIDTTKEKRFTLTNGRLVIHNPNRTSDEATYQCIAENTFGSIFSNPVSIRFGFLDLFNKIKGSPVSVQMNYATYIPCNPPEHYPEARFDWYKDDPRNVIDNKIKPYIFKSDNGNLYFSTTKTDDRGVYHCMVSVEMIRGTQSEGTDLKVIEMVAVKVPVQIHNDFPRSTTTPTLGEYLKLECFAQGTGTLVYSWSREGGELPARATLSNLNRVLFIPETRPEDEGNYVCSVLQDDGSQDSRKIIVNFLSKPYFTQILQDSFIDVDGDITLKCTADGNPKPKYEWYKNTVHLDNATLDETMRDRVTINGGILTIKKANKRIDDGMYQCSAENTGGTTFTSCQVSVVQFAPSFVKVPMSPVTYATEGGETIILCVAEGAPKPEKKWYKNNGLISPSTDLNARLQLLPNGNLKITRVAYADQGIYKCVAENKEGKAETSGRLIVLARTGILAGPVNVNVLVNTSITLPCNASVSKYLDFTYVWKLNRYPLNLDRRVLFENAMTAVYGTQNKIIDELTSNMKRGEGLKRGYLIIDKIRFTQQGEYACVVETSEDEVNRTAVVNVLGPPGEPSYVKGSNLQTNSIELEWSLGPDRGAPITSYIVEGYSSLLPEWTTLKTNIIGQDMIDRKTLVVNLIPYSQYLFRMRAVNKFGVGDPSRPSTSYTTMAVPPQVYPKNIRGGGGKVGTLLIRWDKLAPAERGGPKVYYNIRYRENANAVNWAGPYKLPDVNSTSYSTIVGVDKFYTQYDVQVQACNNVGCGVWSPIYIIYSAEGMPVATPIDVRGNPFNSTCIEIIWENPDVTSRSSIKGVLQGYRIDYWLESQDKDPNKEVRRQTIFGIVESGHIIGLEPDTYYKFYVRVFNDAGNGPPSMINLQKTWRKPPQEMPLDPYVRRLSRSMIRVEWKAIVINSDEEGLLGYKIRYWTAGEGYDKAVDYIVGVAVEADVPNIREYERYYLRVLAYNMGGDGTMSSPVVEFEMGPDYFYTMNNFNSAGAIKPMFATLLSLLVLFFLLR